MTGFIEWLEVLNKNDTKVRAVRGGSVRSDSIFCF